MQLSPLLDTEQVRHIVAALHHSQKDERLKALIEQAPREVVVHVLRALVLQGMPDDEYARMLVAWEAILQPPPAIDQPDLREALWRQSTWWDAFGDQSAETRTHMNRLEETLRTVGCTQAGIVYFQWVAEHPPNARLNGIWDEHRRGALVALGQYGYGALGSSCEVLLARHLDDWINVQTDVIDLLVAFKSRLLARLAPWYMAHDPDIRPFLQPYFEERSPGS